LTHTEHPKGKMFEGACLAHTFSTALQVWHSMKELWEGNTDDIKTFSVQLATRKSAEIPSDHSRQKQSFQKSFLSFFSKLTCVNLDHLSFLQIKRKVHF
jgi:hypothetical protein